MIWRYQSFFGELESPQPDYYMGIGLGTQWELKGSEKEPKNLLKEQTDRILVYDTRTQT
ncbi:MAG: hypothetical protein GXY48_08235 [Methanomicrobiales archaeon]|nr:hypothetical protein [Methanomicrobiales archaeon]